METQPRNSGATAPNVTAFIVLEYGQLFENPHNYHVCFCTNMGILDRNWLTNWTRNPSFNLHKQRKPRSKLKLHTLWKMFFITS